MGDRNGLSPWQLEPASPGPEGSEGEEASERTSCDPAALLNQSEGGEEDRAQTVGDKDAAENADSREADLATRGALEASEGEPTAPAGIRGDAGQGEVTTQQALQSEEREAA